MDNIKPIFSKNVDLESRDDMLAFLRDHLKYFTMNSWNRIRSYANNVKLRNLEIPDKLMDKAYEFIGAERNAYYKLCVDELIYEFMMETGYTAGFNGRSSGYIVMYDTKKENGRTYVCYQDSVDESDIDEWSDKELRDRVTLVQRFDRLCDDIRELFIDCLEKSVIETIVEYIPRKVTTVRIPEYEGEGEDDDTDN